MPELLPYAPGSPDLVEYQIIRSSGVVLLDAVAPEGCFGGWSIELGFEITGPCVSRYRYLPDGRWYPVTYFPDGYPGPDGPWPVELKEAMSHA